MTIDRVKEMLETQGYIAEENVVMSIYLAMLLSKPILIEGPAGVGKTEIAKVIASGLDAELIRLQCYEGLDAHQAIYEWNYQKQLMYLKMNEQSPMSVSEKENHIYGEDFLLSRPLLRSIQGEQSPVLLIDEIDRADEEFESFFLELLSEFQVTIPEVGTIKAKSIPYVIITSNRVRELSEALRRRCLYLWIDLPSYEKELAIIHSKLPDINPALAKEICKFMEEVRTMKLDKQPGIAETIDWATALSAMHIDHLDREIVENTLGIVLKDWQDMRKAQDSLSELFEKVGVLPKMEK